MTSVQDIIKPGMRCAFYGRYSTDKQDYLLQLHSVEKFVENFKCRLVQKYTDGAVSSTKKKMDKREYLKNVLMDALDDKFDFIAVYKEDRLARDVIEHENIRRFLRDANKPIIITSNQTVYDESDILLRLLKDGLTSFEAARIRERTRDALEALLKKGRWAGGRPPFGYEYDKRTGKLGAKADQLELVKQIFSLYLSGVGCSSIAKHLPPNSNRGTPWTRSKVELVIKNPFYAGYIVWGKRSNRYSTSQQVDLDTPDESLVICKSPLIEPVITREEWERCWKLYNQRSSGEIDPHYFHTNFLLRDVVVCKHCNQKLGVDDQRTEVKRRLVGKRLYKCPNCEDVSADADLLEDKIKRNLINRLSYSDTVTLSAIKATNQNSLLEINETIERISEQIRDYSDKVRSLEFEIRTRMNRERNDTNNKIIEILTLYRIELTQKVEFAESQIQQLQARKSFIEKIEIRMLTGNP
ncbi:recombinase family protein [Heliobacterium chlorum]|uniref:Recombinase family protein n=1 Tax=Heliobacterium chlorum TaxID=2698 RepID=A0ABR7SZX4_HELCL|nr:recombinase family protein [Heliobacterium chlorum]MBC9783477.1 recombinase family protein [Heliobacterium chlorum]